MSLMKIGECDMCDRTRVVEEVEDFFEVHVLDICYYGCGDERSNPIRYEENPSLYRDLIEKESKRYRLRTVENIINELKQVQNKEKPVQIHLKNHNSCELVVVESMGAIFGVSRMWEEEIFEGYISTTVQELLESLESVDAKRNILSISVRDRITDTFMIYDGDNAFSFHEES